MANAESKSAKKQRIALVDKAMMVAAVLHPMSGLPQVVQIYTTQDVTGVSLWTWIGFMVIGSLYLYYGVLHKLKPIILTQVLWFAVDLLVVVGVLLYS